jgi:hypothetical protein
MTKSLDNITKTITDNTLAEYGVVEKPKPTPAFKTVTTKRQSDSTPDLFRVATPRKVVKPLQEETALEVMQQKLYVRQCELERMIDKPDDWTMAKGQADAEIGRHDWEDFTLTIAKYIGVAMDARGLKWKSGHDWSLERGALVEHINKFVKDNAVFRDASGRNYLIKVKGE